ncbi:MAG TPA: hypothetical protein VN249_12235, partial [Prolixibacteraceae bacterium]|nr:hypothetical protein [Prolixibacteraceae bacterium]
MRYIYLIFMLFAATLLYTGCQSDIADSPEEQIKDKYLVSYKLVRSMTATDVRNMFSPVQSVYPDVAEILPSVLYGAKVYAVSYNTALGTKKLVASGLVCIPDGGGTYPILSFQNGTNTVYANAPSLNATNYTVQLISGFAATGFVMVLPDYLGF